MGVNRQFQAKTAKYKNRNISKTINRIKTKFEDRAVHRQLHFVGGLTLPTSNPIWQPAAILKKWIWRQNSTNDHPITTKFGRQMQNNMPMSIHRSKLKREIELQYGGRPFSETGSSYISAVDWATSSKFGVQIDFRLLKQISLPNLKPEVHSRLYGCHLEKSIWRHISADHSPITTKLGRQMHNYMPMTMHIPIVHLTYKTATI